MRYNLIVLEDEGREVVETASMMWPGSDAYKRDNYCYQYTSSCWKGGSQFGDTRALSAGPNG